MNVLTGLCAVIAYFGFYMFTGILLPEKWHGGRLLHVILLGFAAYYSLFELLALPLKLINVSMKVLTAAWFAVLLLIFAAVMLFKRRQLFAMLKKDLFSKKIGLPGILFAGAVCALIVVMVLNVNHISGYDFGYYIGIPNGSVFKNTLENVDAFTGEIPNAQREFYLLNTNLLHSAVMFQALNLTPLIEAELTLTVVIPLLFVMILWKAGELLFAARPDDADLRAGRFVIDVNAQNRYTGMFVLTVLTVLVFSFGISGSSMYFVYRPFEGKGILSFLIPSAIFAGILALYREKETMFGYALLFLMSLCGIAFANSAVFIVPGMIAVFGFPYFLSNRNLRTFRNLVITIAPSVFWAAVFVLL